MKELYHIVDNEIPVNQDFKLLKEEALSYVQKISSAEWTNLNPSDPGVTILDQLCYALTELGYCTDFPTEDILSDQTKNLNIENQFYLPDEILTIAPVTLNDYIKLIIDGVEGIDNAVMVPKTLGFPFYQIAYQPCLLIDQNITDPDVIESIINASFRLLNKNRTLGELFLKSKQLTKVSYSIKGEIAIKNEKMLADIIIDIQRAIRNYIFPKAKQFGYEDLQAKEENTNTIFNGPNLKGGWIENEAINNKKNTIKPSELSNLIASVDGVEGYPKITNEVVNVDIEALINFDLINSVKPINGKFELVFSVNSDVISNETIASVIKSITPIKNEPEKKRSVSTIKRIPDIPQGTYRDINSYYSIQNTFPEIFPVGPNSITHNNLDYKIAQSLQLRGYLTLFDQLLANQFSQLANISNLFSFKNAITGCPSDLSNYIAKQDILKGENDIYPAPYQTFSPTYFYQSLYDVPHIKPLLKDNDALEFGLDIQSKTLIEEEGWKSFKEDPYNRYIYGLKEIVEDDVVNYSRRNEVLDHLLARHGESPLLIDAYISGSKYTADTLQDRIIYKSLYLQNLGLLSYHRAKGYNFLEASALDYIILNIILTVLIPSKRLQDLEAFFRRGYSLDAIFDVFNVDKNQQLSILDFANFSAVELKFSMLFGLQVQYGDFITENYIDKAELSTFLNLELAAWMIEQQRGLIAIESSLLLQNTTCSILIIDHQVGQQWGTKKVLDPQKIIEIDRTLKTTDKQTLLDNLDNGYLAIDDAKLEVSEQQLKEKRDSHSANHDKNSLEIKILIHWKNGNQVMVDVEFLQNRLNIFIPEFIPQFSTTAFQERSKLFFENELPINMCFNIYLLPPESLERLINAYVNWHNALRNSDEVVNDDEIDHAASSLITLITEFKGDII